MNMEADVAIDLPSNYTTAHQTEVQLSHSGIACNYIAFGCIELRSSPGNSLIPLSITSKCPIEVHVPSPEFVPSLQCISTDISSELWYNSHICEVLVLHICFRKWIGHYLLVFYPDWVLSSSFVYPASCTHLVCIAHYDVKVSI